MPVLATDTFSGASGPDLGANWTPARNSSGTLRPFALVSGGLGLAAATTVTIDAGEGYNAVVWPSDQYSEVVLGDVSTGGLGTGYGPFVRLTRGERFTGYCLDCSSSGFVLRRFNSGREMDVIRRTDTVFATGDTIRLEVRGENPVRFALFKNGVEFSPGAIDITPGQPLNGDAGIRHSSTTQAGAAVGIDSWAGGSLPNTARGDFSAYPRHKHRAAIEAGEL